MFMMANISTEILILKWEYLGAFFTSTGMMKIELNLVKMRADVGLIIITTYNWFKDYVCVYDGKTLDWDVYVEVWTFYELRAKNM